MITEYQIANFKAFGSPQTLPIRPITLIFGPNSSGKSSIFQSFLMLKQTIEQPEAQILSVKGNLVDLGSYKEFIHRHNIENKFEFKILIKPKKWYTDEEISIIFNKEPELLKIIQKINNNYEGIASLRIVFNIETSFYICVEKIELSFGNVSAPFMSYDIKDSKSSFIYRNKFFPKKPPETDLTDLELVLDIIEENSSDDKSALTFETNSNNSIENDEEDYIELYKFLPDWLNGKKIYNLYEWDIKGEETYYSVITILTSLAIKELLKEMIYIGPMREFPERYYALSGIKTTNVGKSGKFFSDLLIVDSYILQKVNNWFERFDIRYELKVPRLSAPEADIQDVYSLRLFDKDSGIHVGLTDVGFGVSQVLPVIVQSVASQGKTILIEQPEYHLHPRLQAELGDMFIESALGEQKNTFLIETHSEHLILRILRRIRETSEGTLPEGATPITPDQVSVVYFQPGPEGSQIIPLPVTEDGDFSEPWPDGFFTERAEELF